MTGAALQPFVTSQRQEGVAGARLTSTHLRQWTWQASPDAPFQGHLTATTAPRQRLSTHDQPNKLGSYYCWNRVYEPNTGRWTTTDPAMQPWSSLASYTSANPLSATDASGLQVIPKQPKFDDGASTFQEQVPSLGPTGRVRIKAGKSGGLTTMQIELEGCCNFKFYQIVNRSLHIVQRSTDSTLIKPVTTSLNDKGHTLKVVGGDAALDGKDDLDNLNSKIADVIGAGGVGEAKADSCWMSDTPDVTDEALKALYTKVNTSLIKDQGMKYNAYDERELVLTLLFTTYVLCDAKLQYTVKWQTTYSYNQNTGEVAKGISYSSGDNTPDDGNIPKAHQDLIDNAGK